MVVSIDKHDSDAKGKITPAPPGKRSKSTSRKPVVRFVTAGREDRWRNASIGSGPDMLTVVRWSRESSVLVIEFKRGGE